jgi:hypothetical protein
MRNSIQLIDIAAQAKAWLTETQQKIPMVLEKRLPDEFDLSVIAELQKVAILIDCLDSPSVPMEERNVVADFLVGNKMVVKVDASKKYVQLNYDDLNDYVFFNQN